MATGRVIKRNEKWAYVISLPPDPTTGRYQQKWRSGFTTKKAAQEALTAYLSTLDEDVTKGDQISVGEFLDEWIARSIEGKRAPRTLEAYAYSCTKYINPSLGKIKLSALDARRIEALYTKLAETLKPSSVHRVHRTLKTALNRAVKWGYIAKSPMERVDSPTNRMEERMTLSVEHAQDMLFACKGLYPVSYVGLSMAVYTGLRKGEICGLYWSDVDWERRVLRVVRSRQRVNRVEIVGAPKTAGSTRGVPFGQQMHEVLKDWYQVCRDHADQQGVQWSDDVYVMRHVDGSLYDPGTMAHDLRKVLRRIGLPLISQHDLRHTHATLLLQSGVPLKVVSERLGHASITLTANTYAHVTETMQQNAVEKMDELFKRP